MGSSLESQCALHGFDQSLGNRQSQSQAAGAGLTLGGEKRLVDLRLQSRGDPFSVVGDEDLNFAVRYRRRDPHFAVGGRRFDRIDDDVVQHLPQRSLPTS